MLIFYSMTRAERAAQRKGRHPGKPAVHTDFRQRCRDLVLSADVWKVIVEGAAKDYHYALEVADRGFGRPGQALDTNPLPPTINVQFVTVLNSWSPEEKRAYADTGAIPQRT